MSYGKSGEICRLTCDLCGGSYIDPLRRTTATAVRKDARQQSGWRNDKLNRDVCPRHSKLKGAR